MGPARSNKKSIPLVIAGSASGVGKTTAAIGIMGAFRRHGFAVAPFKTGPDFIDPGYHQAVTGALSRNLDTWLTSAKVVKEIYSRGSYGADISVIEGAMGLFDGRSGGGDACSTAEIARLTGGAVVLVVDCARTARSLAPLLSGFAAFDGRLNLAGCILNNVGSASHARALEAAAAEADMPVLGLLPRRADIHLESRHLGLVPAVENSVGAGSEDAFAETLERIVSHIDENVDLEAMRGLTRATAPGMHTPAVPQAAAMPAQPNVRLAVARDEAFCFYYADSLEALELAGAELVFFSPLRDVELPPCDGIYIGGGYPEIFAPGLEANSEMRGAIAAAVGDGMPVYAECGGLVYLCRDVLIDGRNHKMAGALPLSARMTGRWQALGYVEALARGDNLLLVSGERIRGHVFHWSAVDWRDDNLAYDYVSTRQPGVEKDGFNSGNLLASYVHIHFSGNPGAAARFVDACAGVKKVSAHAAG